MQKKSINEKQFWHSRYFLPLTIGSLIFIILIVQLTLMLNENSSKSSSVVLAVDPQQSYVEVPIVKPVDFKGMTLRQILDLRKNEIAKFKSLINGEYQPTAAVFEGLNESGNWMSIARLFYYGKKAINSHKFYKESAASSLMLNPFMLVKAEFWGVSIWGNPKFKWNKNLYPLEYLHNQQLPLTPPEEALNFYPASGNAELTYNLSSFITNVNRVIQEPVSPEAISFGLAMQNARDLGFRYSYLDTTASSNITSEPPVQIALDMPDRFDYMPVSWTNKLVLNHSSPSQPGYNKLKATALPATAVIKLWYEKPVNISDPANYIFKININ